MAPLATPAEPQPYPGAPEDPNSKFEPHAFCVSRYGRLFLFAAPLFDFFVLLYRQSSPSFCFLYLQSFRQKEYWYSPPNLLTVPVSLPSIHQNATPFASRWRLQLPLFLYRVRTRSGKNRLGILHVKSLLQVRNPFPWIRHSSTMKLY